MEGLEKFREAFEAYLDNYVIIGGTACDITMTGTTVRPRATHDIDMIVVVRRRQPTLQSISGNLYEKVVIVQRNASRKKVKLQSTNFIVLSTEMLWHPDILGEPKGLIVEPLPVDEETSSLRAIIMDDDCYHFTIQHSKLTNGLRHADSAALIALKARAYLNLLQDKANGKHVNSKDIKKHRSDVLKNVVIMEDNEIIAPESIVACIRDFVTSIRNDWNTLSEPLAKALDQNSSFIEALLEQLDELFITEQL